MEETLVQGLRELRSQGFFCDVALTAPMASSLGDASSDGDGGPPPLVAHQVVLAAVSKPLRDLLVNEAKAAVGCIDGGGSANGSGDLASRPVRTELRLGGLACAAAALPAALAGLYGERCEGEGCEEDLAKLAEAWGVPAFPSAGLSVQRICAGLREMRSQDLLCDMFVVAGGQRFKAHQAVLAAASAPLRQSIEDKLRALFAHQAADDQESVELSEQPLELDLEGISRPEAVSLALDYIYGAVPIVSLASVQRQDIAADVQQIAAIFQLPALSALVRPVRIPEVASSVVLPEVQPEAKATSKAKSKAAAKATGKKSAPPQAKAPASPVVAIGKRPSFEGISEVEDEAQDEDQANASTELEKAFLAIQHCSFASTGEVPSDASISGLDSLSNQDRKLLGRLSEAFEERPVWLEQALCKRMPSLADEATMLRFLPYVAYQWSDGPWQTGYTRLGWDPRVDAEEAKVLQVLPFRDPHFKSSKGGKKDAEPEDCSFRRPPSQKVQLYQFTDIQDDYIASLVDTAETLEKCDKRSGWLPQFVMDVVKERLAVKSQMLREKIAQRASVASTKAAASGRGANRNSTCDTTCGSRSGRGAKRVSTGSASGQRASKRARAGGA